MLVDEPIFESDDTQLTVYARVQSGVRRQLLFWGLMCIVGTAVAMILVPGLRNFYQPMDVVVPAIAVLTGVGLIIAAGRPNPQLVVLAQVDREEGTIRVTGDAAPIMEGKSRTVWLDEVASIVFGLTRYEFEDKKGVSVEAFTVCLRLFDGSVLPVVEASPLKQELFEVAKALSAVSQAPIEQAGLGA